jgi:hypothetical protein
LIILLRHQTESSLFKKQERITESIQKQDARRNTRLLLRETRTGGFKNQPARGQGLRLSGTPPIGCTQCLTVKHCAHNLAFLKLKAHSFAFDCTVLPDEANALVWYAPTKRRLQKEWL